VAKGSKKITGRGKEPEALKKWTYNVWAPEGRDRFTQIPNLLFENLGKLGINPSQQAVLFHLLKHWQFADNPPVVKKETLARDIGITPRQVQRHLKGLREQGLIETKFPRRPGLQAHQYTFDGLVKKLGKLANDLRRQKKWIKFEQDKEMEF